MTQYYIHQRKNINPNQVYPIGATVLPNYIINTAVTYNELDYENASSPETWKTIGSKFYDYISVRDQIKIIMSGSTFSAMTSINQETVLEYCATDDSTLVGYIMAKRQLSLADAVDTFLLIRSQDIRNASDCFYNRIKDPVFTKTVIKYLGMNGAELFLDAARNFIMDLKDSAVIGTQYGNNRDGLMDYIESTGSYTGGGLSSYSIEPGFTLEDFVSELKNIIIG